MGRLTYHRTQVLELDDRTLAHIEAVASNKLRRGEPFLLTVPMSMSEGSGRITIWVSPGSNLVYRYRHERPKLNPAWIRVLSTSANAPGGLVVTSEPGPTETAA